MDKLKTFLANMTPAERANFAHRCDSSAGHLRNIAYGFRTASERLSAALERESGGCLRRQDFFPDDWQTIWPELAERSVVPEVA